MFRKSLSRVTNTAPNTNAVAAIQRSFSSIGSPACSRVRLTRARIIAGGKRHRLFIEK